MFQNSNRWTVFESDGGCERQQSCDMCGGGRWHNTLCFCAKGHTYVSIITYNYSSCIELNHNLYRGSYSLMLIFFRNPRSKLPGRLHLIWIVRHESELSWIAKLANDTILQLRNANRPDRLHLELYVTNSNDVVIKDEINSKNNSVHVVINENGDISHMIDRTERNNDEKTTLLTPFLKRNGVFNEKYSEIVANENNKSSKINLVDILVNENGNVTSVRDRNEIINDDQKSLLTPNLKKNGAFNGKRDTGDRNDAWQVIRKYPLIGCRVKLGRPHWDRVFGYWMHLYPE